MTSKSAAEDSNPKPLTLNPEPSPKGAGLLRAKACYTACFAVVK